MPVPGTLSYVLLWKRLLADDDENNNDVILCNKKQAISVTTLFREWAGVVDAAAQLS